MTSASYFYGESKPSDNEDDHHIDRVDVEEEDGDTKLVEHVNHYMAPPTPEVKVVSADNQYRCNVWAHSRRHLGLLVDELEFEKKIKDKYKCITIVKM
jgi:hypothetical protein